MSSHIDYQRFRKGEGCLEEGCRAKRFYIEDGKKYCKEGHEQSGFTQTQQDEDDWNAQGKKTKKARAEKERIERIYTGREATDLYLQCYMVLLMKQCHWLVTVKGFPEKLEQIVKDLFEIRVKILYKERQAKSGYASSTIGFSSTEGETSDSEATEAKSMTSSRRARKAMAKARENLPKLVESLAWCYLGMLWLKQPTSLGEVYKWAMTGEMIYTRAIQEIPKEMKIHLPSHYYAALEMRSPLKGADLHGAVLEHIEFYDLHINMGSPTLNFPLLIYKHIRDLALPVEIYPAVRRLARLLNINFAYPTLHQRNYSVTAYPEIQLISLIVVATKLSQPFDSIKRHPESNSDPTVLKIDWELWDRQMSSSEHVEGLKRGQEVKVNDEDVFEFDNKELDDYMDWYQRNFDEDRTAKKAAQIIEPFVLPALPALQPVDEAALVEKSEERLKQVQNGLIIQKPIPTKEAGDEEEDGDENEVEGVTRPGELYRRWRTVDELPKSAKAFYEKAAEITGIFVQTLVKGVFETEKKLEEWQHAERKRLALEQRRKEMEEA